MATKSDVIAIINRVPISVECILERHEMWVCGAGEHDGRAWFELEAHTDGGGDVIHTIWMGVDEVGDEGAWRRELTSLCDDYDPWREAHVWMDEDGNPVGTPFDSGYDLYMDYVSYKSDTLEAINDELQKAA